MMDEALSSSFPLSPPSSTSRSAASADDNDEVYVAMGEDVEESEPNLFWALCNLKPNKICILHVHVPPLSIPFRSAMFLKGIRREDRITEYQKMERRKVETVVNGYLTICHQAGVEAEILYATRDSIENGIIDFISTHGIKKLVVGAKKAVYVCKYAPNFCYIWIISKGFLTYTRENDSIKEVIKTNQESPKRKHFEGKSVQKKAKEVPQTISDNSSLESFSTSPREKDKSSLCLPNVGMSEYVNEAHNDSSTFNITGKTTSQDFYNQVEQTSLEIRDFKRESYECSIKRNKFELETVKAQQRERELRTMFGKELNERIEFEKDLAKSTEDAEKMKLYLNEVNAYLHAAKQENSSLESSIESSNKMVKEMENKMVIATNLLNKFKEDKEQLELEKINADKLANQLREREVDTDEGASHMFMPQFFLSISSIEIQDATRNFDRKFKLLEDDFRCIYRGVLHNTQVKVEVFRPSVWKLTSKFYEEVAMLSKFRHPNLIKLMGVCTEKRSVVYEHLENGSLEDRLSCKENTTPLSWKTRINIAAELCSVLIFLHSFTPNPIIYGDLKPSNVFLDASFKPKLGELGITFPEAYDFGHMDPEFLAGGELTLQCNVYSFGIILLRLLTGRGAPGLATDMQKALTDGNLKDLLDQTAGEWPLEQANQLFHLAIRCVEDNPWRRPDLDWSVWSVLESITTSWQISTFPTISGEDAPTSFMCPINQEVMQDSVIAADGFSYEKAAIKAWLDGGHDTSPMTNLKLSNCNLVPNYALRSAIKAWLQHHI